MTLLFPWDLYPSKEKIVSTLEEKESFVPTNIRVLSYSGGPTTNEDGLIYCMVGNKEGTLPALQEFKMNLGKIEEGEQGTAILKRDFFKERIYDVIVKNSNREYSDDNIPEYNPIKHSARITVRTTTKKNEITLYYTESGFSHKTQDGKGFKILDRITETFGITNTVNFVWPKINRGDLRLENWYHIIVPGQIRESANLHINNFPDHTLYTNYIVDITFSLKDNIIHGCLNTSYS